jgi:(2Fe-2S) ferredoxin
MSVRVILCRDCCCGTLRKHPEVDHDGQREALREAAERGGGRLVISECLKRCEVSNVVVVKVRGEARWFGGVLTPEATATLAGWLERGAPDPMPSDVVFYHVAEPEESVCLP